MKNEKNAKKSKIAIFSPYLDILGGGEKYIFSIAEALSKKGEVYLYADKKIGEFASGIFGIELKRIHLLPTKTFRGQNLLKRYLNLRQYDVFFYMTDGSLFFSAVKKNFLIIQSPLHIPKSSLLNKLKLYNWQIICYSRFMQDIIRERLGENIKIFSLPPYIRMPKQQVKPESKENIILSVGRFFPYPHDKKHAMLVDLFKSAYEKYFAGWKLIIAGGLTEKGGKEILSAIENRSRGFPIEIMVNIPSDKLSELYQRAKIYWHAAGFGEDLVKHPEKAEHFGIAPLEAMASAVVPVVFNGGGLRDTMIDGKGGYFWNTPQELIEKTASLINNVKLLNKQGSEARIRASDFSCRKFYEKLEKIIAG